jgi:tetratricopeptide (TPR) repeat protein
LIAERLSGQAPFMAHDPFFTAPPVPEPAPDEPTAESAADTDQEPASAYSAGVVAPEGASDQAGIEPGPIPSAPIAVSRQKAPATGDEIDLTIELGDLHGGEPAPSSPAPAEDTTKLDQVFSDIRTEAAEDPDFSAQHMTLARTYIEIGMLDEAVTALEAAVRSPRVRFEAAAALGRLYDRRGDPQKAIEWLERAAGATPPAADDGRSVLYDLGVLLEGTGETSRALAVFLELQADAGDYRDVPARIDRLARVQTGG